MARERCGDCGNAVAACICKWTSPIFNQTPIVILQHIDEAEKALGTAKIVSLCLRNVMVKVGVDFSADDELNDLISRSGGDVGILYPSVSSIAIEDWASYKEKQGGRHNATHGFNGKALIVLDGTWRNTREIMHVNNVLQSIPAVKLNPTQKSNYRIRKAPFGESLSTVEAVCQALNIIEPETEIEVMLACFNKMIDYQISRMGENVYRRNYLEPQGKEC